MRKFVILFILFYQLCFLNQNLLWADSSVEEDMRVMKEQFATMQSKMNALEDKVTHQQEQINGYEASKQGYERRIADLEDQLAKQPIQSSAPAAIGGNRLIPAKWTPEIGVMADTVLKLDSSKADVEGNNRLSLRELELILGSNIDPFSRLDATISFSDSENPDLEEAYITRFGLPFDTTAKIGELKPRIGKVLGVHRDGIETVDEPLVIQRYFGTEGMHKAGAEITKTLDLPLPVTQQVMLGVMQGGNGDNGTAFGTTSRAPTLYGHLKNYRDLSDTMGLEFGTSYMGGSKDENPNFNSQILAFDTTLTKHLNANQDIKLQAEAFNLNRKKTVDADGNLWGAYGLLDVHFLPAWSAGLRYDYAELVDNPVDNPRKADYGGTAYLTFVQSEFARWRVQYEHTVLATGKDDNTVYLQGTFVIGDHKHKLQ